MVISGVNTVTYNGDGITYAWPYTFKVTDDSEIRVQLNNADGTAVIIDSDFYVDLVNSTVYYPGYAPGAEPPESEQPPKVQTGQTITVYREIPITQEADLGDKWPFEVIEKGLDKLTMIAQQIDSGTKRTIDNALASMELLADVVVDSGELQHITEQLNAIDDNAEAAADSAEDAADFAELAKDWATKTNGTVDGVEYSAKKYAGDSAASATNAATSATNAQNLYNALIAQGGHPFQAATVAAMTDTTKIYVYTGSEAGYNNGDWYYYDGAAWVSGGVYNAVAFNTDSTLTISGASADSKVVGDYIHNLNDSNLIQFTTKAYIATNLSAGSTVDLTPVTNNSFSYSVFNCTPGTKITLNAKGWTTARLWAFIDSNNKMLNKEIASATATNMVIVAPPNTAKCIINSYTNDIGFCYVGTSKVKNAVTFVKAGENLFNPEEAVDNKYLNSSSPYIETSNNDRWVTGFIPYDQANHPYAIVPVAGGTYCYDDNFGGVGSRSVSDYPWPVPVGTKFIRLWFEKSEIPFEERGKVFVGYADMLPTPSSYQKEDAYTYNPKPTGLFNLDDLKQYASDGKNTFTSSFSFSVYPNENAHSPVIISAMAKWTGTTAPTIKFRYHFNLSASDNDAYSVSIPYVIGGGGFYDSQEWRVPPMPKMLQYLRVIVDIPVGTTLTIQDIHNEYSSRFGARDTGVRFNAHQGYVAPYPQDSIASFNAAAQLGFNCCITIPKITSDGVLVCFHDDSYVGTRLLDSDGNPLSAEERAKPISAFTYAELQQFYLSEKIPFTFSHQQKIPTLEQFFAICSKTGMHPMLSVHPYLSLEAWQQVRSLAEKYGVLKTLNVKTAPYSDGTPLTIPFSVLGNDIESYSVDINLNNFDGANYINTHLPNATVTKCVEIFDTYITDENIASVLSAGCKVACATTSRHPSSWFKDLMAKGVTEFTTDNMASVGLNW